MSFSLYSYLKENPRLNGPKVNYNWSALLNDDDVPESVKAELNELIGCNFITLTDAVLFWSDYVHMLRMIDTGEYKIQRGGKRIWCQHNYPIYPEAFSSPFALMVYSLIQLEPEKAETDKYAQYVYSTIFNIEEQRALYCKMQNWTIDRVRALLHENCYTWHRHKSISISVSRLTVAYFDSNVMNDSECFDLYDWLDESFMAQITRDQLRQVIQLVRDCDKPTIKFRSMNDVERAHDARTEREVLKLAKDGKVILEYHPDLEAVVEKFGFTLPDSNIAMIKRGRNHNNCVATYFDKHKSRVPIQALNVAQTNEISRIFFTSEATLELGIEYCSEGIISTRVIQYKGRFNRDATRDKALIALRITLVGMPAEVLVVRCKE
jgi:hypothetical protein